MRKSVAFALLAAILAGYARAPVVGQEGLGGAAYTNLRQFRIPLNLQSGAESRIQQMLLFASTDEGRTWRQVATTTPEQGAFRFSPERDGAYWFAVQSIDRNNRANPPQMDSPIPSLKVVVDSTPPAITLQPLAPRGSEVGVSWQIRDESGLAAGADAVRLEYRGATGGWIPLFAPANAAQFYWTPSGPGPYDVRLIAKDRAGNVGESSARVGAGAAPWNAGPGPGSTGGFGNPAGSTRFAIDPVAPNDRFAGVTNPPTPSELKLVGSKRVTLNYDLKDVGPSRVSALDLWYTHDGRAWNKYSQPFSDEPGKNLVVELEREGLYGISLVAKSGVGLGERPPQTGDRPQLWIEVDLTKPQVALRDVLVGQGLDKNKLKIAWTATDRNLGPGCVSLRYAEQAAGPWTTIAEKVNNLGDYVWTMPPQVPYQLYIKVEAVDRAGNVGEDVTPNPVKVDQSIPRAIIRDASPANN